MNDDFKHKAEDALEHTAEEISKKAHQAIDAVAKFERKAEQRALDFLNMTRRFSKLTSSGGLVLMVTAVLALIVANSPLYESYSYFLERVMFTIGLSDGQDIQMQLSKPILLWINDGLMAIFFFLVGLEIKREIVEGTLSTNAKAFLPAFAAVGGMVIPALIFWFLNRGNPAMLSGWAIPAATDIAFALGVLALLKSRVPVSLKVLLTAIAIIDDLGAVMIIALFYSHQLHFQMLFLVPPILLALFTLNRRDVASSFFYVMLGILLWVIVLKSGVHATLAGFITALFIPTTCEHNPDRHPAKEVEHALHPWVAFGVLPAFAFANAGVPFHGIGLDDVFDPVVVGITLGLFAGKQIGVFSFIWLAIKTGLSPMPENTNWAQLYGVSILCGIGFTMSLFIGGLAYDSIEMQASVRMGVLAGSVASAILGYLLLRYVPITDVQDKLKDDAQIKEDEEVLLDDK